MSVNGETVLRVEGLRKSYRAGLGLPPRPALAGLDLEVSRGGIIGLLGPNGAGKTTTLKCVIGLVRPDAGRIWLFGEEGTDARARRRLGFLPEQPYFDLYLTPRKLLSYYGRLAGVEAPAVRARISYLLNLVGMGEEADLPLEKFSKGMLQRVGLAQALVSEPDLLILDEPSSGLDPLGKMRVRDLLEGLRREGKTILLSSHQLSEVEEVCDAVVIIHRGRRIASGTLDELLRSREEYEIGLEEKPPDPVPGLPPSASWLEGEGARLALPKGDLNHALRALVEAGAKVARVEQRRMTLEEYFVSRVGESGWEVGE